MACPNAGQEIATGHWTISNRFKQMSAYITYTIHYMTNQKSLMSKQILDLISCFANA